MECRNLTKRCADVEAVRGLDLHVEKGECFGLLGPNGAGKTTTVELIEGLTAPTGGHVRLFARLFAGMAWAKDEPKLQERIGITLQETRLTDKLTVIETLALFRSFYRFDPTEELCAMVQLEEKRDARYEQLSGGHHRATLEAVFVRLTGKRLRD